MSNSRMRAPALAGVATVRGARGAPGPTLIRARGTMNEPTSVPAPRAILAEVSSDAGRAPPDGQLMWIVAANETRTPGQLGVPDGG